MKHKKKSEIKLGKSDFFVENMYGREAKESKCPKCGGILVANCGFGVRIITCVDCDYNDTEYD